MITRMKKNYQRLALIASPLVASALLNSCVVPNDAHYSASGGDYGVYTTLPTSFNGDAYYHNGRYYSGGNYETGRYDYNGRRYDSRYYHDGKYIYGGKYKRYNDTTRRSSDRNSSLFNVYTTLPSDYDGDAYYYNGRYYAGGRYENGRYDYDGSRYSNRYYYDGRYIYGGKYYQY